MGRGRVAACVGVVGMVVAMFACGQLVGIGSDPPQGPIAPFPDSGAEGGFTYGQGTCATCVATNCETEATMCAANPSCSTLASCMSAANGDATLRAQCGVDHGLGNDVATPAFEACLASSCSTECGLTCGGLAAVFPPATATGCEGCIKKQECDPVTACAQDATCQAAVRCQFTSGITLDVQQACPAIVQDAGLGAALMGANPPVASTCPTECSWGADWSCLGKVSWPAATRDAVSVTVYAFEATGPVDEATAVLCATNLPACVPPLAGPATSDAGGTITVQLSTGPELLPLLFVDLSAPTITPGLIFDVFPISQRQITIPFATAPQGSLPALALQAGVAEEPGLGMLLVVAVDCRLAPAPGVTFDLEPKGMSTLAYVVGSLPVIGATATDSSGTGVFANTEVDTTLRVAVTTPQGPSGAPAAFTRDGGLAELYAVPMPIP